MTDLHQTDVMLLNEDSLKTLIRGITQFQGEFSLILAVCNYRTLRERIVQQLREQCPVDVSELVLEPSVQTLYTRLAEELGGEQPDALMIFGLESVRDLDPVLTATNQIREEFRKFAFPLVLWVTDEILQKLIRLIPDFHSWATTVEFQMTTDELIEFIRQTVNEVFAKVLNAHKNVFLDNAALDLEKGSPRCAELKSTRQELLHRGVKLDPESEAGLEFVLGRVADNSQVESRHHYERSLTLWQQTHNLEGCGVLLYYLGLWWRNYAVRHRAEEQQAYARAKDYFQQSIEVFEQANRPDLAAKFINFLAEMLHRLKRWDELEAVAKKALALHQIYSDPFRQARDYGFLAEVALSKSLWIEAKQAAQQALFLLTHATAAITHPSPEQTVLLDLELSFHQGWYLFSLAKAQGHLGQVKEAIATLETARDSTIPHYDPELYILILKALRESYFQQKEYLTAFHIKQERQAIESQFGLRAFIGAGRLQPKQQVTNPALPSAEPEGEVAQEIASSGRLHSVERLLERIGRDDCKLTVIHGESGVGKSSIEQAGLIPALKQTPINARNVLTVLQQVYADWTDELGKGLAKELVKIQKRFSPIVLKPGEIENDKSEFGLTSLIWDSTEAILSQLRENSDYNLLTILIFDQFEEFFFTCITPQQRKKFYDFLRECLDIPYVKIILSLREDYLHYLLECTRFIQLEVINNNILDKDILFYLGNFTPNEAKLIIQSLTEKTQFYLEPALIDELVKDLAGGINEVRPVELQIVGAQLQAENITTLAQYQAQGPKAALVERFLQEVIKDCGSENQQLAELVLWLLTDENSTRPLRTQDDLKNGLEELITNTSHLDLVLEIFVKSGLVLLLPSFPENLYQLVHDYLAAFVRQQKNNELIEELGQEREQRKRSEAELNRVLKRQLKVAFTGGILMTVLAVMAGVFGVKATIGETNAELREISAASESLFASNKELEALVEGLKAGEKLKHGFRVEEDTRNQVLSRLQEVVYGVRERNRLEGHADTVTDISFSRNGQLITTSSNDKTVKLWSRDGKEIKSLGEHSDGVTSVAFSPNGKIVASGSKDKNIILWNLDGTQIKPLSGHDDWVTDVSFSSDGQSIASASEDKTVKLWRTHGNGTPIATFAEHESKVTVVRFSPDDQTIASASEDGTIKLWNPQNKKSKKTISSLASVLSLAFSSDGKTLIGVCRDNTLRMWSLDGTLLKTTNNITWNIPVFASFSPDGKVLITFDGFGQGRLWKIEGSRVKVLDAMVFHSPTSAGFSPDHKIITLAGKDNVVEVVSLDRENFEIQEDDRGRSKIVGFSPRNFLVSVDNDLLKDTLKFWHPNGTLANKIEVSDAINNVNFRPDGQIIASTAADTTVKVWNRNGTLAKTFGENALPPNFSPDSQLIVVINWDNTAQLWGADGKLIATLQGHTNRITKVVFSPNSQLISTVSRDNTAKLWNRDGKLINTLQGHKDRITEVTFSPDSQLIATASWDNTVKLWNREGKLIKTSEKYNEQVEEPLWRNFLRQVTFSPDSQMLFVPSDSNDVKLWGRDGKIQTLKGHDGQVNSVSFSPNSQIIATTSDNKKVRLWNRNGTPIKTLEAEFSGKTDVSFSPDSKLFVSVSRGGRLVKLWTRDGKQIATLTEQGDKELKISFSPDSQNIALITKDSASLWSREGKLITTIKNQDDDAPQISVSKDGKFIASVNKNNQVALWSSNGTLIQTLKGHHSKITLVSFSPDSQTLATADKDNIVKLWRSNGTPLLTLQGHGNRVEGVSLGANGKTVAISGVEDVVKLWNSKGEIITTLKGHRDRINSVSFSPKGQLITSASDDKTVRLWRLDGTPLKVLTGHKDKVNRVRFSPGGQFIASASSDKTVKIWNQDGTLFKPLEGHKSAVRDVSFSPDSQIIASGSDDSTVILWKLHNGEHDVLPGHAASVKSVSFNQNGQMLASADDNSGVKIWGRNGTLLKSFSWNGLTGNDINFSSDGQKILAWNSNYDGKPSLWSVNLDELLERGCRQVRDYLKSNQNVDKRDRPPCDGIGTQN